MHSIFAVNKPPGPTSHDMIYKVRKMTGEKRVGHAGTLDPFAEGVLVVAVGREFTKQLSTFEQADKEYLATLQLGATSTTDDPEGEITKSTVKNKPSLDDILEIIPQFTGTIEQLPPIYSAIKVNGVPAHRRVRRGQTVALKPRIVQIFQITVEDYNFPQLTISVHCGKGVYIRSLARDIGDKLRTGAYLTKLVRTRVGKFTIDQAITL